METLCLRTRSCRDSNGAHTRAQQTHHAAVVPCAGHCIDDATAQYIVKAADPQDLAQKASHLHMDDYGPPPAQDPYRPSKNMVQPPAKGGRKDLFDVLRGRCGAALRIRTAAQLCCCCNCVQLSYIIHAIPYHTISRATQLACV